MEMTDSTPARGRRTAPAAAALFLLAGLVIAGAWSTLRATRTADDIRRSSTALVGLAKLRSALVEARVETNNYERPDRSGTRRRNRGVLRRLAREQGPAGADSLAALVRERAALVTTGTPDELLLLDADIDRLARIREMAETRSLDDASARLDALQRQTLFVNVAVGLVALGAAAVALQHRFLR